MNIVSYLIAAWVLVSSVALGYDGTITFDSILLAHPSPTFCPSHTNLWASWTPDSNYLACCDNRFNTHTLTTGIGPGGKPLYACCQSGYTCTAPVSLMKEWSMDSNAPPPTPTAAPGAGITTSPAQPSTGTFSGPGATPLTTSAGVIVYVSNTNNNKGGDQNVNVGNTSGGPPSPGAIAGITVACTVVSTIAAVLGLWYARKRKKAKEAKSSS
ncbi:hypothetical protein QBC37DRAFT_406161 [Rhypophila decipiens]|uniref:Uncharacterized protein n=1 Tax=Rhypophila decipiens TaxID=261697 RepID=A0AAN6XVS3_9PEZI|nr:hypothetical protein QBC37DRAFT_406161 [Rhypophila decipiens]